MTIRSMPPASSHLAERPVPAPPPMMGSPRSIMAWNFSISFLRSILAISAPRLLHDLEEILGQRLGEGRVVYIVGQADQPPARAWSDSCLQRLEEGGVGGRIPEGSTRLVEERGPAFGNEKADRPLHPVEALADPHPHLLVLRRGGAHQRHLWVVAVEIAA